MTAEAVSPGPGKISLGRARTIGRRVGCDAVDILLILEGWTGPALAGMTNAAIAQAVTARLDSMVANP